MNVLRYCLLAYTDLFSDPRFQIGCHILEANFGQVLGKADDENGGLVGVRGRP